MKKMIIFLGVIILGISNTGFNFKKEEPKKMIQILYTQEGTPYIVKTVTQQIPNGLVLVAPTNFNIEIDVNNTVVSANFASLGISTNKKIIPISASFGLFSVATGHIAADMTECYYSAAYSSGTQAYPKFRKSLAKSIPYIDRVFFTDALNHCFNSRYNQIIFNDDDFLEVNNPLTIIFHPSVAEGIQGFVALPVPQIPAGAYFGAITFVYYEMVTK